MINQKPASLMLVDNRERAIVYVAWKGDGMSQRKSRGEIGISRRIMKVVIQLFVRGRIYGDELMRRCKMMQDFTTMEAYGDVLLVVRC